MIDAMEEEREVADMFKDLLTQETHTRITLSFKSGFNSGE